MFQTTDNRGVRGPSERVENISTSRGASKETQIASNYFSMISDYWSIFNEEAFYCNVLTTNPLYSFENRFICMVISLMAYGTVIGVIFRIGHLIACRKNPVGNSLGRAVEYKNYGSLERILTNDHYFLKTSIQTCKRALELLNNNWHLFLNESKENRQRYANILSNLLERGDSDYASGIINLLSTNDRINKDPYLLAVLLNHGLEIKETGARKTLLLHALNIEDPELLKVLITNKIGFDELNKNELQLMYKDFLKDLYTEHLMDIMSNLNRLSSLYMNLRTNVFSYRKSGATIKGMISLMMLEAFFLKGDNSSKASVDILTKLTGTNNNSLYDYIFPETNSKSFLSGVMSCPKPDRPLWNASFGPLYLIEAIRQRKVIAKLNEIYS